MFKFVLYAREPGTHSVLAICIHNKSVFPLVVGFFLFFFEWDIRSPD